MASAKSGEGSSPWTALRFVAARWRSYCWIAVLKLSAELVIPEILFLVLVFGAAIIGVLAGVLGNGREPEVLTAFLVLGIPAIASFVPFLWLGSCLSLAVPASALEGTEGWKALRRSWALTKDSRLRILVTILLVTILSWLLLYGLQVILRWIIVYLCREYPLQTLTQRFSPPVAYLLYAIPSALISPIYPIVSTLFYYDQRIRHEGYDIERMMEAAGLNAPEITPSVESSALRARAGRRRVRLEG